MADIMRNESAASSFPLFTQLPLELRRQIWQAVLPTDLLPILRPYEAGHYRYFWTPGTNREHFDWVWSTDLLYNYIVPAPLLAVNTEARSIMLAWIDRQRVKLRLRGSPSGPVYLRDFDVQHDAIYLPPAQVPALNAEYYARTMQPPLVLADSSGSSPLRNLAIPWITLTSPQDVKSLCETICVLHGNVDTLYIVIDPPDELLLESPPHHHPTRQWEFEISHQAGYHRTLKDESNWTYIPGSVVPDFHVHMPIRRLFWPDLLGGMLSPSRAMEIRLNTARLRRA